MGDFRKAGTDRGDLGKELKHMLISARIKLEEYSHIIDELERDELEFDLQEYKAILKHEVLPLLESAIASKNPKYIDMAQELKKIYDEIIEMIEKRL